MQDCSLGSAQKWMDWSTFKWLQNHEVYVIPLGKLLHSLMDFTVNFFPQRFSPNFSLLEFVTFYFSLYTQIQKNHKMAVRVTKSIFYSVAKRWASRPRPLSQFHVCRWAGTWVTLFNHVRHSPFLIKGTYRLTRVGTISSSDGSGAFDTILAALPCPIRHM